MHLSGPRKVMITEPRIEGLRSPRPRSVLSEQLIHRLQQLLAGDVVARRWFYDVLPERVDDVRLTPPPRCVFLNGLRGLWHDTTQAVPLHRTLHQPGKHRFVDLTRIPTMLHPLAECRVIAIVTGGERVREPHQLEPTPRTVIRLLDHRLVVRVDNQRVCRLERDRVLPDQPGFDVRRAKHLLQPLDIEVTLLWCFLNERQTGPTQLHEFGRVLADTGEQHTIRHQGEEVTDCARHTGHDRALTVRTTTP